MTAQNARIRLRPDLRANRCGAPTYALDPWAVLDRFLVLGTVGGTYYAGGQELRREHLWNLLALLDEDGPRVIGRIVEISRSGRAPRNAPACAALALAASVGLAMPGTGWTVTSDRTGDTPARAATRALALVAMPQVCRIPTDLFDFIGWLGRLRGFGPAVTKAVSRWYAGAPVDRLALHAIKYQSRKGFAHADLLRLAHPRVAADDTERRAVMRWMLNGGIAAGLDARLAAKAEGVEGNPTPSATMRQLEAAEDLLEIDRLGAERARAAAGRRAAEKAAARVAREAMEIAFGAQPSVDESRILFGVSTATLKMATSFHELAFDYLDEPVANDDEPDWNSFRPSTVTIAPAPSLFEQDEVARAVALIQRASLPHEAVPSHLKRERAVWDALLVDMPMQAMVRNITVMTRNGLLTPGGDAAAYVCSRLRDPVLVRKSRLHPLTLLQAAESYRAGRDREVTRQGRGRRPRNLTWVPVPEILSALDDAFHLAFHNVTPANVRMMLGVDVSGSMEGAFIGDSWLSARSAAAAMCLVTARTEVRWDAVGFTSGHGGFSAFCSEAAPTPVYPGLTRLPITKDMSVAEAARRTGALPMGSTDCALPIRWALERELEVDCFVVYTDNEHNSGPWTPARALRRYRAASGIQARLVCVGMTATDYTIADPRDPLCLNVVGFDSAAPQMIADFAAGRV